MSEIFKHIRDLVSQEQEAVNQLIRESLYSSITLINQISEHIIKSGGKRLRPLLVLLSAKAFGYEGFAHIQLAAIMELLHTASLLHDDVVDRSEMRRGQATANKLWGDHASVLVGDYLYSRAFQLIVKVDSMQVMTILAQTSNQMAEGEVLQLINCHNPDISEADYLQIIHHKTGTLFSAAAQMGPVLTNQSSTLIDAMRDYGGHLGNAFQLVDDALDYSASSAQMGKNLGDDLLEGKPTLPFIRALKHLESAQKEILCTAMRDKHTHNIPALIKMIESTDAIAYTHQMAEKQADLAKQYLAQIPGSVYREGLDQLLQFALARHY
jgi:octaprenyl-diphosphate synthase